MFMFIKMSTIIGITIILLVALFLIWYFSAKMSDCSLKLVYPEARRDPNITENHFGVDVPDPYRWLEDPDSEETQQYVEATNEIAQPFLENCDHWKKINKKLTALWNYPKYNVPYRHGDYYFSYMNTGLQNQK